MKTHNQDFIQIKKAYDSIQLAKKDPNMIIDRYAGVLWAYIHSLNTNFERCGHLDISIGEQSMIKLWVADVANDQDVSRHIRKNILAESLRFDKIVEEELHCQKL